jgi:transcriptional regulator with XRE-family HTH domain
MVPDQVDPIAIGISGRIARLIEARGISSKILAERAQLSSSAVTNILNGVRQPGIEVVQRIAVALGTDCHFLITGTTAVEATPVSEPKSPPEPPPVTLTVPNGGWAPGRHAHRRRRRARDIMSFRERMEARRQMLESWESEARSEILICWKALALEPEKRLAASRLISFFVRYRLPLRRWGLRRFIPGNCEPRPGATYTENPTDEQLLAYLKRISPVKLRILHEYLRDLLGLPTREVKEPKAAQPPGPGTPGEAVPPVEPSR